MFNLQPHTPFQSQFIFKYKDIYVHPLSKFIYPLILLVFIRSGHQSSLVWFQDKLKF